MDPVWLARLQFALTIMFHFLFPPISIGLAAARLRSRDARAGARDATSTAARRTSGSRSSRSTSRSASRPASSWSSSSARTGPATRASSATSSARRSPPRASSRSSSSRGSSGSSSSGGGASPPSSAGSPRGSWRSEPCSRPSGSSSRTPGCRRPPATRIEGGRAVLTDFRAAVFNPSTLPRFVHTMASACALHGRLRDGGRRGLVGRGGASHPGVARVCAAPRRRRRLRPAPCSSSSPATGTRGRSRTPSTAKFAAMEGIYSTERGAPLILFSLPPTQHGRRPRPRDRDHGADVVSRVRQLPGADQGPRVVPAGGVAAGRRDVPLLPQHGDPRRT